MIIVTIESPFVIWKLNCLHCEKLKCLLYLILEDQSKNIKKKYVYFFTNINYINQFTWIFKLLKVCYYTTNFDMTKIRTKMSISLNLSVQKILVHRIFTFNGHLNLYCLSNIHYPWHLGHSNLKFLDQGLRYEGRFQIRVRVKVSWWKRRRVHLCRK